MERGAWPSLPQRPDANSANEANAGDHASLINDVVT
jgi:hypothetical protein